MAQEENQGRMEKRVDLDYFMSDSIKNHWCMVIMKSRLTFSQLYFIFVCKFLIDNASPYYLHLECTAGPGLSAEAYGRSVGQTSQTMPLLPNTPTDASPICALALGLSLPANSTSAPRKKCSLGGRP